MSSHRRHLKDVKNAYDREHKLHTFSVGLRGSPDLVAARRVAKFLGTIHHEFTFTVEEGLDALEDLIWHLESVEQARLAPCRQLPSLPDGCSHRPWDLGTGRCRTAKGNAPHVRKKPSTALQYSLPFIVSLARRLHNVLTI